MDDIIIEHEEKQDKRNGIIVSTILHVILIILAVLPLLTFPDPPPGQAGVLVSFGDPDAGQGEMTAPIASNESEKEVEKPKPETKPTPKREKKRETKPKKNTKPKKTQRSVEKEVTTDDNSKEIALQKAKKLEESRKRAEAEAREQARAEEEARQRAVEEEKARKRAAAEEAARKKAEERAKLKQSIGNLFSGGGNNNKPGKQGQTDGDPAGKALDGISTGSGELGGGIAGREVRKKPSITDRSQNTGIVSVYVCVDNGGSVVSAKYTQNGSTTNNSTLIRKAVGGAKAYKFNVSDREKQCGTIKIHFKVQ